MARGLPSERLIEAETLLDEVSLDATTVAMDVGVVADDIHYSSMKPTSVYLQLKRLEQMQDRIDRALDILEAYERSLEVDL
jgi:hypothetical protein